MNPRTLLPFAMAAVLGAFFLCPVALQADVVRTKDGRELEGKVREVEGGLEVTTTYGIQVVPQSQVVSWERGKAPQDEYADRAAALEKRDATAADHYALARWCESKRLRTQAEHHLRQTLQLEPEHEQARLSLGWRKVEGKWVSPNEVRASAGLVRHEGKWMLPEEQKMLQEAVDALSVDEFVMEQILATGSFHPSERDAARAALKGADPDRIVPQLLLALHDERWTVRAGAAEMLGHVGGRDVERRLVYTSLADRDAVVREAAIKGLRDGHHPDAYQPYVRAMASENRNLRLQAVQALGQLGDDRAVSYLIKHIRYHGGGPRAHIYQARQLAYIRDFDVEVAQAAAIADPIIGTIQDGLVLDVDFLAHSGEEIRIERRITHGALKNLTGAEPAPPTADAAELERAWTHWWRQHRHEYEPGGSKYRAP